MLPGNHLTLEMNRPNHCFQTRRSLIIFLIMIITMVAVSGCDRETALPSLTSPELGFESLPPNAFTDGLDRNQQPGSASISDIQGTGHISPYNQQWVSNVHGIVTVICSNGFYLQSVKPDDNPSTSEGIFVFTELVPSVSPGIEVLVSGQVIEWVPGGFGSGNLSITQMANPEIELLSSGNYLPAPVIIGEGGRFPPTETIDDETQGVVSLKSVFDPENDALDFYESLEGMLVQVNGAVVVGPTNPYKEIVVLADGGVNASLRTPRGGIVIREGDKNPERIILDDKLVSLPFVQVGDKALGPIIGVMDYDYGNYKIQVTAPIEFRSGGLEPTPPLPPGKAGFLRVASYNVGNLSALETGRIRTLAEQIVFQMASPDIIGLQEIQDNDGSSGTQEISADETYQGIIEAIQNLGGPLYGFVNIDPIPDLDGGIPGGNIRVGFLYRLDSGLLLAEAPHGDAITGVEIMMIGDELRLSLNPGRIDPGNSAFLGNRKPLVVTFIYQEKPLFVINNHFVSKGSDTPLFGEYQPPLLNSEYQRLQQAQVVHDFAAALLSANPDASVIVMGDLNDYHFSAVIEALKGGLLHNLVETLPSDERYTFIYEGNSEVLDHIIVSESLMRSLVSLDILHINSEFDFLRQFSDHDVVVATFKMD